MVRAWSNIFVMWYITFVLKGIYLWALTMTNKVYFAKKKKKTLMSNLDEILVK